MSDYMFDMAELARMKSYDDDSEGSAPGNFDETESAHGTKNGGENEEESVDLFHRQYEREQRNFMREVDPRSFLMHCVSSGRMSAEVAQRFLDDLAAERSCRAEERSYRAQLVQAKADGTISSEEFKRLLFFDHQTPARRLSQVCTDFVSNEYRVDDLSEAENANTSTKPTSVNVPTTVYTGNPTKPNPENVELSKAYPVVAGWMKNTSHPGSYPNGKEIKKHLQNNSGVFFKVFCKNGRVVQCSHGNGTGHVCPARLKLVRPETPDGCLYFLHPKDEITHAPECPHAGTKLLPINQFPLNESSNNGSAFSGEQAEM